VEFVNVKLVVHEGLTHNQLWIRSLEPLTCARDFNKYFWGLVFETIF